MQASRVLRNFRYSEHVNTKHRSRLWVLMALALALLWASACTKQASNTQAPATMEAVVQPPTATLTYLSLPTVTPTPAPDIVITEAVSAAATEAVITPENAPAESPPTSTTTTIQPGDTLLALAMRYNLPMAAIQMANKMGATTDLYAGQTLAIPAAEAWRGASPFWVTYEVLSGDTLTGIANRYGLDFVALVAVNEITDADVLSIGKALILPLEVPAEIAARSADTVNAAVAAAPPAPAPAPTDSPPTIAAANTPTPEAVAVAPTPVTPAPAAPPPGITAPAEIVNWPAEVFALINAERAAAGLGPFIWNDTLAQAAYLHGLDCQQRGSCNHTGSDGSTVKMRVLRAGYPAVGAAECIVYSKTPQQAVFWWMDEVPPDDWHRRTILSTWVTEIGIAVVPNHLGSYYFIADFGRPQ